MFLVFYLLQFCVARSFTGLKIDSPHLVAVNNCSHPPLFFGTGFEASEDKAYKEPLLADPDEPPPEPVMLAEPCPIASVTLECSEPAYTEYPEPGQPGCTGGLVSDWLFGQERV